MSKRGQTKCWGHFSSLFGYILPNQRRVVKKETLDLCFGAYGKIVMNEKTAKSRLKALRGQMRFKNIDCMIITTLPNVNYITGFTGHDSWAVVIGRSVYLITDSRYTEQAQKQCPACKIVERKDLMTKSIAKIVNRSKSARIIGLESSSSVSAFSHLKRHLKASLKPVAGVIESIRRTKDPDEVKAITRASKIAWRALEKTVKQIKFGITENQLAGLLDFEIRKLGSRNSFETIVAFGANASRPHHQPGKRALRKNDTILFDFGAEAMSYGCDITRCFTFGKPSTGYSKVYVAVARAQKAAIKTVGPGVKIKDVAKAAREVLASHNLPAYGHGTGHGFGLEVHESPIVNLKSKDTLRAGDVITIEPGVYIPGKLGVRIEDDILVTETGHKILSSNKQFEPMAETFHLT